MNSHAALPAAGPWRHLVTAALAALGFFLPFSSAGVSVSLAALLVLALLRPLESWRMAPWREPVMAAGLALLGFIAIHTLWTSGAGPETWHTINRYHELLFAPLVLVLMRDERGRLAFLRGFIASAVLVAAAYWWARAFPDSIALNSRRISAGFTLAVAAFLVVMRPRGRPLPWTTWALAGFLAATVLFAIDGRTGHVVLLALVPCVAWYRGAPRWRWAMVVACPLVVVALALSSSAVESRLRETVAPPRHVTDANSLTSTEIRVELLRLAVHLAREHWVTGVGFANYPAAHEQAAHALYDRQEGTRPYLGMPWIRISNPHSEYLMQLLGGGIVALGLFLAWLGLAFRRAALMPAPAGGMLAGVGLAFAVGCAFNSMLLNFGEGHVYMALLGWLVAEGRWGSPQRPDGREFGRILVLATRQIGDVLLTTPLIHAARQRWPAARIEVLGFEGTLGMLRGNPDIDALVETPAGLRWRALPRMLRLWRRYDLALIADLGDRAHILGWAAAPVRSGLVPVEGASNWWKRRLLAHAVVAAGDRGGRHVTCEKRELLAPWIGPLAEAPRVVPPAAAPLPDDIQNQLARGFVVVHAPSMWPYKQWPVQHFKELVGGLLAQGRQVALTGSASTRDRECIAPLLGLAQPPALLDLSGRLDFNQLVTLMQQAALYIGPDTSVSHLAAATGVQVIAIFGPTNPVRWAPWPAQPAGEHLFAPVKPMQREGNVVVLQSTLPCVPCGRAGCENHRQSRSDCLIDISAQRVLTHADTLLSQRDTPAVPAGEADRRCT